MGQLWLLIGVALGATAVYLMMRGRIDHERRAADDKVRAITQARDELANQFTTLSSAALEQNNTRFLQLAEQRLKEQQSAGRTELESQKRDVKQLVKPVEDKLAQVDRALREMEKERSQAYGGLNRQLVEVAQTQQRLQAETANLVTALRPDVVVKLPGGKDVVVDAKAPLAAYLDAIEAKDEVAREAHLDTYARHVREHIQKLSAKSYSAQFDSSPEFVVMFLPGEVFYSAALERMPDLIERSVEEQVLIATPTTLIALLKAVAYGWRQERMAESAEQVSKLGRELYERLGLLSKRFAGLGKKLDASVKAYNDTVATLESRVLVSARRFEEHGAARDGVELEAQSPVEITARRMQVEEIDAAEPVGELTPAEELL